MAIFYSPNIDENSLFLDEEEARHCVKVLRKKVGDKIEIRDGKGKIAGGIIKKLDIRTCEIEIIDIELVPPKTSRIHLAVSPTKNQDRIEWLLEKAIEIGLDEISFPITDRTERPRLKMPRLEKIALSALKQSQQAWLCKINDPKPFKDFLEESNQCQDKFIAYLGMETMGHIHNHINQQNNTLVLIGPEGDFTKNEIKQAFDAGFQGVTLGENRLRTETAALYAITSFQLKAYS